MDEGILFSMLIRYIELIVSQFHYPNNYSNQLKHSIPDTIRLIFSSQQLNENHLVTSDSINHHMVALLHLVGRHTPQ